VAERDLIQVSIVIKAFLNWLRTAATWHTWNSQLLAVLEQRIIDRAKASAKTNVSLSKSRKTAFRMFVLTFDTAHCSDRIETLFV